MCLDKVESIAANLELLHVELGGVVRDPVSPLNRARDYLSRILPQSSVPGHDAGNAAGGFAVRVVRAELRLERG